MWSVGDMLSFEGQECVDCYDTLDQQQTHAEMCADCFLNELATYFWFSTSSADLIPRPHTHVACVSTFSEVAGRPSTTFALPIQ